MKETKTGVTVSLRRIEKSGPCWIEYAKFLRASGLLPSKVGLEDLKEGAESSRTFSCDCRDCSRAARFARVFLKEAAEIKPATKEQLDAKIPWEQIVAWQKKAKAGRTWTTWLINSILTIRELRKLRDAGEIA